jgi:hypothetical protein
MIAMLTTFILRHKFVYHESQQIDKKFLQFFFFLLITSRPVIRCEYQLLIFNATLTYVVTDLLIYNKENLCTVDSIVLLILILE